MKPYRKLAVYKVSNALAVRIHKTVLPTFEPYEEGSQVKRLSKYVTAMIVEGCGRRRYKADFIKYLVYA